MTLYPFEVQLAVDASNAETVIRSGTITFYDPSDTGLTNPIDLVDTAGITIPNPMTTTPAGLTRAFQAEIPHVLWSDGTYAGYLSSYKGLLDEATAARDAAEAAIINGVPAGGTAGQVLAKTGGPDYAMAWVTKFVVIGPSAAWPTGLPEGTIVVRSEV
jgi:hypothetical protein